MRLFWRPPGPANPVEISPDLVALGNPSLLEPLPADPPAAEPPPLAAAAVSPTVRWQPIVLAIAGAAAAWIALQLFAGILAPFVTAGVIAYALDPPTTRLTQLGVPRGIAALVMVVAMIAAALLFILLLYPLILSQIGLFLGRIPQYAQLLQHWAGNVIADLQQNFGSDAVNGKLQDLISSQAGNMLTFLASALTGVISGSFALFNVLTLAVVTPVVAFYLLRSWPEMIGKVNSWLPRRYAVVIRAQAREVDRILSAWVRGQALCCVLLALFYALALSMAGLDLGLIVGLAAGVLSFIPYVGSITGGITAIALAMAQFPSWRGVVGIAVVLVTWPGSGKLPGISTFSGRSGRVACRLGYLCVVCRGRRLRLHGRNAGGSGCCDNRCTMSFLAAPIPSQPAVSRLR